MAAGPVPDLLAGLQSLNSKTARWNVAKPSFVACQMTQGFSQNSSGGQHRPIPQSILLLFLDFVAVLLLSV